MSDDPKIRQRYRELSREEPPRHLDDAILAASRRASESRPAPLVVPTGRRRWYFPVAAAAVIVLAVAVTVHVDREQQRDEVAEAPAAEPASPREEPAVVAQALAKAPKREMFTPDPKPAATPESPTGARELRDLHKEAQASRPAPAAAPPPASPAPEETANQARAREEARTAVAARSQRAVASDTLGAAAAQSPEQWLLGIDDLKRQGKHEEAERQLAEFRKRYPNYRIPEAIAEKFEKR